MDTQGLLLGVVVHAADIQDADGLDGLLKRGKPLYPWLRAVFADSIYTGDAARAEGELLSALNIARSQSARLFELRAARDLARLWCGQSRIGEARDLLAPVYASFTEGFALPDLVEVKALLEQLG